MTLANGVVGATHTPQTITWKNEDGDPVVLTGATLTGVISNSAGVARAIEGALAVTDGPNGVFTWTYHLNDVAAAGRFRVQFTATYGDTTKDLSYIGQWEVEPALVVA